jgi:hypothetical protein
MVLLRCPVCGRLTRKLGETRCDQCATQPYSVRLGNYAGLVVLGIWALLIFLQTVVSLAVGLVLSF